MLTKDQKKTILNMVQSGVQKQQIAKLLAITNQTVTNVLATKKRCMVISDLHCGHRAGLTPPKWQTEFSSFYDQQVEMWEWYAQKCTELKPDILFVLGDMVDGRGKKSGGTEQITTSFKEQVKMVEYCLNMTGAGKMVAVYGTPYHTSVDGEDSECFIKNIKISGHEFPKIHDIQFDLKHKIGASSIPHGRYTALAKSRLWNQLWKDIDGQPKSDIIIRGHTHYFDYCGNSNYLAMICPALSGWGSIYGVRQCEGIVNTGLLWFDIYDGTDLSNLQWRFDVPQFATQMVEIYSV